MPDTAKTYSESIRDSDAARSLLQALVERKVLTVEQAKTALSKLKSADEKMTLEEILIESKMLNKEALLRNTGFPLERAFHRPEEL